jgi:hypothetical protein
LEQQTGPRLAHAKAGDGGTEHVLHPRGDRDRALDAGRKGADPHLERAGLARLGVEQVEPVRFEAVQHGGAFPLGEIERAVGVEDVHHHVPRAGQHAHHRDLAEGVDVE